MVTRRIIRRLCTTPLRAETEGTSAGGAVQPTLNPDPSGSNSACARARASAAARAGPFGFQKARARRPAAGRSASLLAGRFGIDLRWLSKTCARGARRARRRDRRRAGGTALSGKTQRVSIQGLMGSGCCYCCFFLQVRWERDQKSLCVRGFR